MERGFPMPKGCYYKGYAAGNRREAHADPADPGRSGSDGAGELELSSVVASRSGFGGVRGGVVVVVCGVHVTPLVTSIR